jgi:hypothetical protein
VLFVEVRVLGPLVESLLPRTLLEQIFEILAGEVL